MKKFIASLVALGFLSIAPSVMALDFGKCINTINKKVQKIQGYDPRILVRQCAWETVSKGKKSKYFNNCLARRLKRNIKNIKDPEHFANNIYNSIKKKCS